MVYFSIIIQLSDACYVYKYYSFKCFTNLHGLIYIIIIQFEKMFKRKKYSYLIIKEYKFIIKNCLSKFS